MDKTNLPPLPDRLEHEALTLEAESRIEANAGCSTNTPDRRAALLREAARSVREAVPDGWVLVPREPTEAMIEAGDEFYPWTRGTESRRAMPAPETIYAAMIAAAPTQDQEPSP